MSKIKLKPCPFCGEEVTTKISASASCSQIEFAVSCYSCGIKKRHNILYGDSFDEAEKAMIKAAEAWNSRAETIIHCKDCKYLEEHRYEDVGEVPYIKYDCKYRNYQVQLDGFCSSAVRRTENETD